MLRSRLLLLLLLPAVVDVARRVALRHGGRSRTGARQGVLNDRAHAQFNHPLDHLMGVLPRCGQHCGTPTERQHSLGHVLRTVPDELLRVQRRDEGARAGEDVSVQPQVTPKPPNCPHLAQVLQGGLHASELFEVQLYALAPAEDPARGPGVHRADHLPGAGARRDDAARGRPVELLVELAREGGGLVVGRNVLLVCAALPRPQRQTSAVSGRRAIGIYGWPLRGELDFELLHVHRRGAIVLQDALHEALQAEIALALRRVVGHDDGAAIRSAHRSPGGFLLATCDWQQRPRRNIGLEEIHIAPQRDLETAPRVHGMLPTQSVCEGLPEVAGRRLQVP
mmetsp:Transcript_124954/g.361439  ORF Transcript_124954/g.361439 Transcript_124954/m.361439 type:complete len:338 (-) Transcript_124954:492-1505(-)